MPRVVITGGAGFLGSFLCQRFLEEGFEVVAVDNLFTGRTSNLGHLASKRFQFLERDVTDSLDIEGTVTHVLHFASPASPPAYLARPIETLRVGSAGTENALELARQHGARFLLASTSEVYGDALVHPQDETYLGNVDTISTRGVYDEAKRYAEALTFAYHRAHGVETRIVRIFNTYGPRMRMDDGRVIPNFIGQALRGEPLTVYGDGSQTRSLCYVTDLIEGVFRLLMSEETRPVNIGSPEELSMLELARRVIAITGSSSSITFRPLPDNDPQVRRPDISRAREVLGWEPKVSLDEGIHATVPYFRQLMIARTRSSLTGETAPAAA